MSKLNRKFLLWIAAILLLIGSIFIYLNSNFIERYYLYEEKKEVRSAGDILINQFKELNQSRDLSPVIEEIEAQYSVTIARIDSTSDNDTINDRLRKALLEKGISFQKYWLWEEDQKELSEQGRKLKLYSQERLAYSLLIEYIAVTQKDQSNDQTGGQDTDRAKDQILVIVKSVPALNKTLAIVNTITLFVFTGAGILMFICISVLVHRITSPIKKIRTVANSISNLEFQTIEIKTRDELELLADDLNRMSRALEASHRQLYDKNREMEALFANVSHDLKTPISLVKLYSSGIKDGLDDGTFADIILKQSNKMEHIVEKLLLLAKLKQGGNESPAEKVNIPLLLYDMLEEYRMLAGPDRISAEIEDSVCLDVDQESLALLFDNLLSNAIKYSAGRINVRLRYEDGKAVFTTENETDNLDLNLGRLWESFYVAEESRNNTLSGTGLGLSIVKAVCEKYNVIYSCELEGRLLRFRFVFPD